MAKLQVGLCTTSYPFGVPDLDALVRLARRSEEVGFDSLWVIDHFFFTTPVLDPIVLLSTFMAHTSRIRLGTAITLLSLRNAVVFAKATATLDYLSRGRLTLGIGIGGEFAKEFEVVGVPVSERGRRVDEGLEVLRRLWTDDAASYEGRFYRFSEANLQPKPVQPGGPPLWIGGRSDAALRRTARLGDGWLGYFLTAERVRESRAKIESFAHDVGRDPSGIGTGLLVYPIVADDEAWARDKAAAHLTRQYNQPWDERLLDRYVPAGPPERCLQKMAPLVAAGLDLLVVQPIVPPGDLLAQVERLGRDVVPELRRLAETR